MVKIGAFYMLQSKQSWRKKRSERLDSLQSGHRHWEAQMQNTNIYISSDNTGSRHGLMPSINIMTTFIHSQRAVQRLGKWRQVRDCVRPSQSSCPFSPNSPRVRLQKRTTLFYCSKQLFPPKPDYRPIHPSIKVKLLYIKRSLWKSYSNNIIPLSCQMHRLDLCRYANNGDIKYIN